jgi:hypothetical protein
MFEVCHNYWGLYHDTYNLCSRNRSGEGTKRMILDRWFCGFLQYLKKYRHGGALKRRTLFQFHAFQFMLHYMYLFDFWIIRSTFRQTINCYIFMFSLLFLPPLPSLSFLQFNLPLGTVLFKARTQLHMISSLYFRVVRSVTLRVPTFLHSLRSLSCDRAIASSKTSYLGVRSSAFSLKFQYLLLS